MKLFSFSNYSLDLTRRRPAKETKRAGLTETALASLNEALLSYVSSLTEEEIQRRISPLVVTSLESDADVAAVQNRIARYGIAVVENFLGTAGVQQGQAIAAKVKSLLMKHVTEDTVETDAYVIQKNNIVLKSYTDLAAHSAPVLNVRREPDLGMVDVFNVDHFRGHASDAVRTPFQNPLLITLLSDSKTRTVPRNLNLYINSGITKTRGFHVDTYEKSLKGFVYLTDVRRLDDGPYCYVLGSHIDGPWRVANQAIGSVCMDASQSKFANTTESPLVAPMNIVPLLAPSGTLILSDQCGIHRGMPQSPDGERHALVMRYA